MNGIVINLDDRPDRMEQFNKNKFPFPVERFSGIRAERGEDGCTFSHLGVLRQQKEFPFAVFEDDCVLIQPWSVVEKAMKQLPSNWDALWLGATLRFPLVRYSENLFHLKRAYCLHAVIYNTKRMRDFILERNDTPAGKNLDIFYYKTVIDHFNCFIVYPMVATQSLGWSNISHQTLVYNGIEDSYKEFTTR